MFLTSFITLAVLVFGMNIVPAFMPPTWIVLAFYHIRYDLPLIPLVVIGATAAALGRVVLTLISRQFFRKFLSEQSRSNYESLGLYLKSKSRITVPVIIAYMFLPIPSNQVFIAAGLAKFDIRLLVFSFFVGRLISYTFWVSVADRASDNLESIFSGHYSRLGSLAGEIIGFALLYLVSRIGWKRFVRSKNLANFK